MSERITLERLEQIQWAFAELLTEARRAREAEARLERERDEAIADNAVMLERFRLIRDAAFSDERHGMVKRTLNEPHPGAALLSEHRKALVRARNEGLAMAVSVVEAMAKATERNETEHDGVGAALWTARSRIRALKEPET